MSAKVSLAKRPNFLKAQLLAPFSARYRARLTLRGEPEALLAIATHIVLTRDHRLAFVKNSKAGCTTVAQVLYACDTGATFQGRVHDAKKQIAGHLHVRECLDALRDPKVYAFSFVRDPLARAVSAFQDFVLDRTNPGTRHHLPRLRDFGWRPDTSEERQFDVFLDYVAASFAESALWTDPHFRLQKHNLALGTVQYRRICRLENYAAEMMRVLQESGAWRPELERLLTMRTNVSRARKYSPTEAQAARVRAIYAADYEAFDY